MVRMAFNLWGTGRAYVAPPMGDTPNSVPRRTHEDWTEGHPYPPNEWQDGNRIEDGMRPSLRNLLDDDVDTYGEPDCADRYMTDGGGGVLLTELLDESTLAWLERKKAREEEA